MDKDILNLEEAAELFGVSIKTFIKLLKEEKVPARKIGREWRFGRKALIEWLAAGDSQLYSSSEKEVKDFFNEIAQEWDSIRNKYYDESIKNKIFEYNILNKNMIAMDIGAGDGYITLSISKYVKKVIAVDISNEMLNELEKKSNNANLNNISTLVCNGTSIPIKDESVDFVCTSMYLHHIHDPEDALTEIYRVLKPGGVVFLADYNKHTNKKLLDDMNDLWPGFAKNNILEYFSNAKFSSIKYENIPNMTSKEISIFVITALKN